MMDINAESVTVPVPLRELSAQELNVLDPFRCRYKFSNCFLIIN